jgi:endonuclease YncB( thermonuclease family)
MFKYSLILALLLSPITHAETLSGRVIAVTDGDTIKVLDTTNTHYKIRLSGIDAPEKRQPFGQVSKRSLSELIYDKQVNVEWSKKDRYQRIVGKVIVNGIDVNLEQVKRGLAWHYKKYLKEQTSEDVVAYSQAELEAINSELGLWVDKEPIAPWEWRKAGRSQ